jgi:hypothetical protein
MYRLPKGAITLKDLEQRFALPATLKRNTVTGVILALVLTTVGFIAGDAKPLMALAMGLIFIPVGSAIDLAWYRYYKKKIAK